MVIQVLNSELGITLRVSVTSANVCKHLNAFLSKNLDLNCAFLEKNVKSPQCRFAPETPLTPRIVTVAY